MKLPHLIIIITMTLIIFALIFQAWAKDSSNADEPIQAEPLCPVLMKNTGSSTVYISNNPNLKNELSLSDIEQSDVIAIGPRESEFIELGPWFSIYTRIPVTNDVFEQHYTLVQKVCGNREQIPTITTDQIEIDEPSAQNFIIIDHVKDTPAAEGEFRLCPGSKKAQWDTKQDQWFCEETREGESLFVPVYSYIYEHLPSWLISMWYTQHPEYYNWYNHHPEFWEHLGSKYIAPWKTTWYKNWHETAQTSETEFLHAPSENLETVTEKYQLPHGLQKNNINIK